MGFSLFSEENVNFGTMTIVAQNITKHYDTQCVLDDISFTLKKSEITGFLGVNGAGKTTTMKILTGYLQDWDGTVTVFGKDLRKNSLAIRKEIGYLPEHNPLDEQLYIREYLQYVAGLYLPKKEVQKAINKVIEKVALGKEQHKKIGQLSKGYKQRVGLAQALIHKPQILILDEPTTGLDPKQLEHIRQLIKEESKNKIVLFSTHIMQEVEAICDRTLIINNGKIVSDSKTTSNLQTVRVAFAESIANLQLPFEANIEKIAPNNFLIHTNHEQDIRPILFNFAKENNLTLLHLSEEKRAIEAIFQQETK